MIQNCSLITVLEIFFKEPTQIHYIREIAKRINLAQTSTRNHIKFLLKENLILAKKNKPFNGFIANRDEDRFIFYKRVYNLYSLFNLQSLIVEKINPKAVIIFGSYCRGEDIETSDIDILIVSKIKKDINFSSIEKNLNRKIHAIFINNMKELDKSLKSNVLNGWIIYGTI